MCFSWHLFTVSYCFFSMHHTFKALTVRHVFCALRLQNALAPMKNWLQSVSQTVCRQPNLKRLVTSSNHMTGPQIIELPMYRLMDTMEVLWICDDRRCFWRFGFTSQWLTLLILSSSDKIWSWFKWQLYHRIWSQLFLYIDVTWCNDIKSDTVRQDMVSNCSWIASR